MNTSIFHQKLEEINKIIDQQEYEESTIGVLSGLSGIALFKFYYSKFLDKDNNDIGSILLEQSIQKINEGYNLGTFCSGIAGMGWVISHLERNGFIDIDLDNLFGELDQYLFKKMKNDLEKGHYDFLHGGLGYAFYFLNRYKNTNSQLLKENYKTCLLAAIEILEKRSESNDKTYKWISEIGLNTKEKGYNLGLSHGMSSIVGMLTKLSPHKDFEKVSKKMLRGTISYILQYQNPNKEGSCLFPNIIHENGSHEYKSRLAWCYGDLGIGIRFWHAAKVLQDASLLKTAIKIMEHAALRTNNEQTMIKDAGLCHGSFGNAQIFLRMYKETNNNTFKDACEFWMQDGLNKATHIDGYAGYKQWKGPNEWKKEVSLLEGVAGIGLTLIDYLADFETSWDECLMIS
ncbi:lanthionine synthetase C family protein [uncultured Aquimarina sp.]|uniref:lanthionine synthetase C family protein n=1 Tax=uncultured Aquimarina sp. TaxID=575652 RepID=UPI0026147B61|nr:lanthionine synthetase C family protein [uncultured Aquimarina sp.]